VTNKYGIGINGNPYSWWRSSICTL